MIEANIPILLSKFTREDGCCLLGVDQPMQSDEGQGGGSVASSTVAVAAAMRQNWRQEIARTLFASDPVLTSIHRHLVKRMILETLRDERFVSVNIIEDEQRFLSLSTRAITLAQMNELVDSILQEYTALVVKVETKAVDDSSLLVKQVVVASEEGINKRVKVDGTEDQIQEAVAAVEEETIKDSQMPPLIITKEKDDVDIIIKEVTTEMSKLLNQTNNYLFHQATGLYQYPILPIISEPKPSGLLGRGKRLVGRVLRVHFLCAVCGQRAPSGKRQDGKRCELRFMSKGSHAILRAIKKSLYLIDLLLALGSLPIRPSVLAEWGISTLSTSAQELINADLLTQPNANEAIRCERSS